MKPRTIFLTLCDLILLSGSSINDIKQLQKSLMTNYSNKIRPVDDQDETIYIYTAFYLSSIVEVDAVQQRLVTIAHLGLSWTDEFLQWDESSTGVTKLNLKQVGCTEFKLRSFSLVKIKKQYLFHHFYKVVCSMHVNNTPLCYN